MSTSYDLLKRWRSSWIAISAVVVFSLFVQTHAAVTGHLTVEWDLGTDPEVVGYVVDYGVSPGGYTAQRDAGYATTLTLWDLEVGETYYLAVRGYTATGGFSDYSNEVFGEALDPGGTSVPPPLPPSGLTAAVGGDPSAPVINLSWSDNSDDEDRFVVERALDGASFQYLGQTAGPNIHAYTDTSVQLETTHAYRVIAQSYDGGDSPPSNIASATTTGAPNDPPSAAAGGPYNGMVDQSIAFDAGGSSDPDGDPLAYTWDFGDGQTGSGKRPSHSYSSAGSFPVILFATDGQGGSDSDAATATVQAPSSPFTLSASGYKVKGRHRATLTWSGATSATVDIYRNGGLIATVPSSPSTYTDATNNRGKGSYAYQVCKAGSGTCSNIDTVKF